MERNQRLITISGVNVYSCSKIYARHETTPEEKITGIVETIDNPFDNEVHVTGLGNKINKNSREKERQKILDRIEDENDEDIREALRHGNTVEIIKDSININAQSICLCLH